MKNMFYLSCGLMVFSLYSMETDTPPLKRQKRDTITTATEYTKSSLTNTTPLPKNSKQAQFEALQHAINSYGDRVPYKLGSHNIYLSSKKDNPSFIDIIKNAFLESDQTIKEFLGTSAITLNQFMYPYNFEYRYYYITKEGKEGEKRGSLLSTPLIEAIKGVNWNLATLILNYVHDNNLLITDDHKNTALDSFNEIIFMYIAVISNELQNLPQDLTIRKNYLKNLQSPEFKDFISSALTYGHLIKMRYENVLDTNSRLKEKVLNTTKALNLLKQIQFYISTLVNKL